MMFLILNCMELLGLFVKGNICIYCIPDGIKEMLTITCAIEIPLNGKYGFG